MYEFVKNIDKIEKVLLDGIKFSYIIYNNIFCEVEKVDEFNLVMFFKV